jgi:hypothetical protein
VWRTFGFRRSWASRGLARAFAVLVALGLFLNGSGTAYAGREGGQQLSAGERAKLEKGQLIARPFVFERSGHGYRGGVSYQLVNAPPAEVLRALRRPGALLEAVPYTLEARVVEQKGRKSRVTMRQGVVPLTGRYTVLLEWSETEPGGRFWLDTAAPHDLRDIFGYFRLVEYRPGVTLLTFAFAFDIGGLGNMFEGQAQKAALRTPSRWAEIVGENRKR